VSWSSDNTDASFSSDTSVTDASGEAKADITSKVANANVTVTATCSSVSGTQTVSFTAPVSTNQIANLTITPMDALPGVDEMIAAQVVDADGAPVAADVDVTWSCTDTNALSALTSKTNDKGIATVTANADYPGILPVTASVDGNTALASARFCSTSLKTAFVPNGMDGTLDTYDLKNDVQAVVDAYKNVAAGDLLTFYWDDVHHYTMTVTNPATDFPLTLDITNDFPAACLANGEYCVFYQYLDISGNLNISLPLNLQVSGGHLPATLPAPTFPEGKDGWINLNEANSNSGTPVNMSWAGMATGDTVHVTWKGFDESGIVIAASVYTTDYTVTSDDLTTGYCSLVVPTDNILAIVKGSAQADYLMTPRGGGAEQQSVYASINVDVQP
jgi:hypothetical protein